MQALLLPLAIAAVLLPWFLTVVHLTALIVTRMPFGGAL